MERETLLSSRLMSPCDEVFQHPFSFAFLISDRTLHTQTKDTKDVFEYE